MLVTWVGLSHLFETRCLKLTITRSRGDTERIYCRTKNHHSDYIVKRCAWLRGPHGDPLLCRGHSEGLGEPDRLPIHRDLLPSNEFPRGCYCHGMRHSSIDYLGNGRSHRNGFSHDLGFCSRQRSSRIALARQGTSHPLHIPSLANHLLRAGRASLRSTPLFNRYHRHHQSSPSAHQHRKYNSFQRHHFSQRRQRACVIHGADQPDPPPPSSQGADSPRSMEIGSLRSPCQHSRSHLCSHRLLFLVLAGNEEGRR